MLEHILSSWTGCLHSCRTDIVFLPLCEVSKGGISLVIISSSLMPDEGKEDRIKPSAHVFNVNNSKLVIPENCK